MPRALLEMQPGEGGRGGGGQLVGAVARGACSPLGPWAYPGEGTDPGDPGPDLPSQLTPEQENQVRTRGQQRLPPSSQRGRLTSTHRSKEQGPLVLQWRWVRRGLEWAGVLCVRVFGKPMCSTTLNDSWDLDT